MAKLKIKLKIKKLVPEAVVPTYGTEGAACFDLYAVNGEVLREDSSVLVKTGLAVEVPEGHVMLVFSRSGQGFNHGIRLSNCVGVIDSDYRGEICTKLHKDPSFPQTKYVVKPGDRVAQALILPVNQVSFEVAEQLTETERGNNGFGSTGL